MFNYRDGNRRKLETCREGVAKLNSYWQEDMTTLTNQFSGTIFGKYGNTTAGSQSTNTGATTSNNLLSATSGRASTSSADNEKNKNNEFLGKIFVNNLKLVNEFYGNHTGATSS